MKMTFDALLRNWEYGKVMEEVLDAREGELMLKDLHLKLVLRKLIERLDKITEGSGERDKIGLEEWMQRVNVLRDDYVWEHLNVGHWKTVEQSWRRIYTLLSLVKVQLMTVLEKPWKDIVRECDMGLLMGEPILNNALLRIAEKLGQIIREEEGERSDVVDLESVESTNKQGEHFCMEIVQLKLQHPPSKLEISSLENPSIEEFMEFMTNHTPALIYGITNHWPALKKWNVEYIRKVAGFRTVPVEIGSKYTSDDWTQKLMMIDDFINSFMDKGRDIGYVAQHCLFEQITELKDDIKIPDYCFVGDSRNKVEINAWFGPGNTVSPTHHDPKHNLLVQIFGTKLVRLYPPSESERLKPFPPHSILFNTSQLDLEDDSLFNKYPDLKNAKYYEFLLLPGMTLYLPPKWWHFVKSLSPSFSISYWFE